GALSVRSAERPLIMGQKVVNDDSDFGWTATWASEMGDQATLAGLQRHAERYMSPSWRNGGYYYPRNDALVDGEGHRTLMEPMCGNVLMGYAALNVRDGLWKLYNEPIGPDERREPGLVEVGGGIDVLQAYFDATARQLHFKLRRCASSREDFEVLVGRMADRGPWTLSLEGRPVAEGTGTTIVGNMLPALRAGEGDAGLRLDASGLRDTASFMLAFRVA
ncbi:MAG TPA: hypothetical protein VE084_19665, partial [Burkholderiaceae bacterium]|nr:hypothetical protein [Burkholderiaceae bacterium]